jgi:hypothetical protein
MNYRTISIGIVGFWLTMMTLLFWRQILPKLTAGRPPSISMHPRLEREQSQAGVFGPDGRRIGTAWSIIDGGDRVRFSTTLSINPIDPIQRRFRMESVLNFDREGSLRRARVELIGLGVSVRATGEAIGDDFSILLKIGDFKHSAVLESRQTAQLGNTLSPFARLQNLHVGKRWRVRLIDPLSMLTKRRLQMQTTFAEVVGREKVVYLEKLRPAFRVQIESGGTSWVDDEGRVLKQEAHIPLFGEARWIAEEFSEESLYRARTQLVGIE